MPLISSAWSLPLGISARYLTPRSYTLLITPVTVFTLPTNFAIASVISSHFSVARCSALGLRAFVT